MGTAATDWPTLKPGLSAGSATSQPTRSGWAQVASPSTTTTRSDFLAHTQRARTRSLSLPWAEPRKASANLSVWCSPQPPAISNQRKLLVGVSKLTAESLPAKQADVELTTRDQPLGNKARRS